MPMKQEKAEGRARDLVLPLRLLRATARVAAPWPMLAAEARGSQVGDAVHGQLAHINDGVHMMDTGHHGGGVEAAHDEAADAEGQGEQRPGCRR